MAETFNKHYNLLGYLHWKQKLMKDQQNNRMHTNVIQPNIKTHLIYRNVDHIMAEMASAILQMVLKVTVNITLTEKHLALPCTTGTRVVRTCHTKPSVKGTIKLLVKF
jgi:hypothetical protein